MWFIYEADVTPLAVLLHKYEVDKQKENGQDFYRNKH